jgi:aspartate racemase
MKTIGIIGGMGPEATVDMYMKIIRYYQKNLGAKYDKDFPEIIIWNVPIPDVVESSENEELTLKMLSDVAIRMEKNRCNFIVIACNTVQYLLEQIRESVKIPILGIAEINAKFVKKKDYSRVGIIGTKTMINKQIYDKDFERIGLKLIKPGRADQEKLTKVIMNQLAGKITKEDKQELIIVVKNLQNQGAEVILVACTDLPMIMGQEDFKIPLIDCTQIYANETAKLSTFKSKTKINVGDNYV